REGMRGVTWDEDRVAGVGQLDRPWRAFPITRRHPHGPSLRANFEVAITGDEGRECQSAHGAFSSGAIRSAPSGEYSSLSRSPLRPASMTRMPSFKSHLAIAAEDLARAPGRFARGPRVALSSAGPGRWRPES